MLGQRIPWFFWKLHSDDKGNVWRVISCQITKRSPTLGNLHDKHGPSFPFPAFNFFYIHPCYVFLPGFPSIPSFPGLLSLLLSVMLHHWCYQGSLAFRRRCGETLQDFCCPPGACGLSRTPQTPITPPLLSSDSKTNPSSKWPVSSLVLTALGVFASHGQFSAHFTPLVAHSSLQRVKWELKGYFRAGGIMSSTNFLPVHFPVTGAVTR